MIEQKNSPLFLTKSFIKRTYSFLKPCIGKKQKEKKIYELPINSNECL